MLGATIVFAVMLVAYLGLAAVLVRLMPEPEITVAREERTAWDATERELPVRTAA